MEEGPPEHFFSAPYPAENGEAEAEAVADAGGEEPAQEPIDKSIFHHGNFAIDIAFVLAQGLEVDNDNEPAPENVPEETGVFPSHGSLWARLLWKFLCCCFL